MLLKNLLRQLENDLLTAEQKKTLIRDCEIVLAQSYKKLTPSEIIYYISDSKLPMEAKTIISSGIKNYIEQPGIESTIFANDIKQTFLSRFQSANIGLNDLYPKNLNLELIMKQYGKNCLEILSDKNVPFNIKKYLIVNGISSKEIPTMLSGALPKKVKELIIEERVSDIDLIVEIIRNDKVPGEIKQYIIEHNLSVDEYSKSSTKFSNVEQTEINKIKEKELTDYVLSMNEAQILGALTNINTNYHVLSLLTKLRMADIKKSILEADTKTIYNIIYGDINTEISQFITENRQQELLDYIDDIKILNIVSLLSKRCLDLDTKGKIYKKHEAEIMDFVKNCSIFRAKRTMFAANTYLPEPLFYKILELKKEQIIEYYKGIPSEDIITELGIGMNKTAFDLFIVENFIDENNIIDFFSRSNISELLSEKIFETKSDAIKKAISQFSIDDLLSLKKITGKRKNIEKILNYAREEILLKLDSLEKNELIEALKSKEVQSMMKKILIEKLGIKEENVQNCMEFLTTERISILVDNYDDIKSFMKELNVDFESFLQYGAGSKKHERWLEDIIEIIKKDDLQEFKQIKNYFFAHYYDNKETNKVNEISNFIEILDNYHRYKTLLHNVVDNHIELSKDDKMNLAFIFNSNITDDIPLPTNLDEILPFKKKIFEKYINKINDNTMNVDEIKDLFNNLLFYNANLTLNNIGGAATLKEIKKDAKDSKGINTLADELIKYTEIIEKVNNTNNKKGLLEILKFTLEDMETLNVFQLAFYSFDEKVRKLFEMDSIYHLTDIEEAKKIPGVRNEELSKKYGGDVLDFSDKNYVLYAHVKSPNEPLENLLQGKSNGSSNFISVNPITYKGQKYYYDGSDLIFLYDKMKPNTFISSSICNMSSNEFLQNNSTEVENRERSQRGILETSVVFNTNSETLLFREGLIPKALVLMEGNEPTQRALEIHQKYNIPFVVTQKENVPVRNPKQVLPKNPTVEYDSNESVLKVLDDMYSIIDDTARMDKATSEFTGREIAIITDIHSMYEPTLAVLEDIKNSGIEEIYSLGDNIDFGPNPAEVLDLLEEYGVVSIAGNSEYYQTLGIEPFLYFTEEKEQNTEWTKDKLGQTRINKLKLYPATIELVLGGEKLALVHFANDVRWDYTKNGVSNFAQNKDKNHAADQFAYTNTDASRRKMSTMIEKLGEDNPRAKGYIASKDEPILMGHKVTDYNAIIQGHLHFERKDKLNDTDIFTLRAVGMGQENGKRDEACYYVLKEKNSGGFKLERRTVKFNDDYLRANAITSDMPHTEKLEDYIGHVK